MKKRSLHDHLYWNALQKTNSIKNDALTQAAPGYSSYPSRQSYGSIKVQYTADPLQIPLHPDDHHDEKCCMCFTVCVDMNAIRRVLNAVKES
jgi:hypothetical protein